MAFDSAELTVAVMSMSTVLMRAHFTFKAYIEIVCNHLLSSFFRFRVTFSVLDYFRIAVKLLLLLATHLFISLQFYYLYLQILYL